jgi:hypothetical protein
MIKKIILVCIVALTTMSAMAQVTVNRGNYGTQQQKETSFSDKGSGFLMKYGVKTGLNMTSMSNGMAFDPGFGMGVGFRVGGFLNMRWGYRTENSSKGTGLWGFQPELVYSNQAVKTDAGDVKMNYIAVPLLLKVYPTTALSIEVGPELSYLISTSPSTMAVDGAEIKVGDCKGMNAGLAAGLAYDFEMGLTVGARYTYGFTDMAKNLKWKNSNIQVTVGWMF